MVRRVRIDTGEEENIKPFENDNNKALIMSASTSQLKQLL